MTQPTAVSPQFNALTDAWLPLMQSDGSTAWASPVEVLCGERDGTDLDYPRDDFRVFARLLLSALVQALFPAKNKAELVQRLRVPMLRAEVMARIEPVVTDFDLFGATPFLQIVALPKLPDKGAAPFVFPGQDLFQLRVPIDAISIPTALVMIFAEQTYAGGAGRGYGAGPAGQPGALTLIDPGSVRLGAWANTLSLDRTDRYARDDKRPWSNAKQAARPRAAIGLVQGLFFQPRGIWLIPAGKGICSFTGSHGSLVRRSPFLPKSELAKKASGAEDLWQHPCAPLAVNSQGIAAIRLGAERPAWTGLAQLLSPLSKAKSKKVHPCEGPALVVEQWKALAATFRRHRLLVLDFDRDKANVRRRFFEAFPLTDRFLHTDDLERLRALVDDAQLVLKALVKALTNAHDSRKRGGFALADAQTAYWTASEAPFLNWLATITDLEDRSDAADTQIDRARDAMQYALRRVALTIFDAHVELSEFDPRKQELVAKARRRLLGALYPQAVAVSSNPRAPVEAPP